MVLRKIIFSFVLVMMSGILPARAFEPMVKTSEAAHFDMQSFNDWRAAVELGEQSDDELVLIYNQVMSTTEFTQLTENHYLGEEKDIFTGTMSEKEFAIIIKAMNVAVVDLQNSFAPWAWPTADDRRRLSIGTAWTCLDFMNRQWELAENIGKSCDEQYTQAQPAAGPEAQAKGFAPLIVLYRTSSFFKVSTQDKRFRAYCASHMKEAEPLLKFIVKYVMGPGTPRTDNTARMWRDLGNDYLRTLFK